MAVSAEPGRLVPCYSLGSAALVPHARAMLDAAGMRYFVKNDAAQNLFGGGALGAGFNVIVGAPLVLVDSARIAEAQALLTELEASLRAPSTPERRPTPVAQRASMCERCQALLEDADEEDPLTHCYHCGWALG